MMPTTDQDITATEVQTAARAAKAAGELLAAGFAGPHLEFHKAARNIVTEMDVACEDRLRAVLCTAFPAYGFLAEESHQLEQTAKDCLWIVDPLDGTTNYARGYPLFAVSVALMKQGRLVLGVVYNPLRDELFTAQHGLGATLNGNPIHATETDRLENALLASGFPYEAATNPLSNTDEIETFIRRTRSVRVDGVAAIDLCHVAAGRLDAYWEAGLGPWDTAAGAVIVAEAGGVVSLKSGAPFTPFDGSVIAANSHLHAGILEILNTRAS